MDYEKKYFWLIRQLLKNNPKFYDSEIDTWSDRKCEIAFDAVYDFLFWDTAKTLNPKPEKKREKIERLNPATIFDSTKAKYTIRE